MNGCQTCGGFGNRHDDVAHGVTDEPKDGYAVGSDGWPLRECDHDGGECYDIEHQR